MNSKILELVNQLHSYFENELTNGTEINIFLCGGNTKKQSEIRLKLRKQISGVMSKYRYFVHYPEDMFNELIYGPKPQDLLVLENLLAKSIDCVVILLQSPGTFTELGAFSNHNALCNKLIVIVDNKYKNKQRSFISIGPIRHLKYHTKSKIIYTDLESTNFTKLTTQVLEAAREIPKQPNNEDLLCNPITSMKFYLSYIYVFEPLNKSSIFEYIQSFNGIDKKLAETVANIVINYLIKKQYIRYSEGILTTSQKGIDVLLNDYNTKKRSIKVSSFLSDVRLKVLNLTLRKYYTLHTLSGDPIDQV